MTVIYIGLTIVVAFSVLVVWAGYRWRGGRRP